MTTDHETIIGAVEEAVRYWERQVAEAEAAAERAQVTLGAARKHHEIARNFLELERQRLAGPSTRRDRFAGSTLRGAAESVIRDMGTATTEQVADALRAGGYLFESKYPGRALHFALMRSKLVKKESSGRYRYVGSEPVQESLI
jgi:hypothetical protein